jgi:lipopolysaccharide transport protein LptA
MAHSRASWLVTLVLGAGIANGAAPQLDQNAPIKLEAGPSDVDYKNNKLAFHKVRITQGGFAIEADDATATGLDFKASQWVFRGNVKITTPDGSLASDEARIAFAANAISTAEITGTPAVFEQKHDKRLTRGRAKHIDYDFAAGTVRLSDGAFLSDGDTEISGRTLVYDMREQRLRANADDQGSQRVRIIITPKKPDAKPNP